MKTRLKAIHPGDVLLEDFLKPMGITAYRVAKDIGVPPIRITEIVRGKRAVSAETALLLAKYFGTSAALWLRLQDQYDLEIAESEIGDKLKKVSPRRELQAA